MINAPYDKEFVFQDGSRARNILDLVYKVDSMDDYSFHHFVNVSKNDFANWVEHVLLDKKFSDLLRETVSRVDTLNLLREKALESEHKHGVAFGSIVHPKHSTRPNLHPASSLAQHHEDHKSHAEHHQAASHKEIKQHHSENKHQDKKELEHQEHHKDNNKIESKKHDHNEESKKEIKQEDEKEISKKDTSNETPKNIPVPASEELEKPKRKWLIFFSREEPDKELEKAEKILEREWGYERENNLWVILYIGLVLLIITLLVYKLFLS